MPLTLRTLWRRVWHKRRTLLLALAALSLCVALNAWHSAAQRRAAVRATEASKKTPKRPTSHARPRAQQPAQQIVLPDGSLVGQPWTGGTPVEVSTAELMAQERLRLDHPARLRSFDEHELPQPNRRNLPQNPNALPGTHWPPVTDAETFTPSPLHPFTLAAPQPVTLNFNAASSSDSGFFPPDSMGAVGPSQYLLCINGRIRVFDKNTGQVGPLDADTDTFFGSVKGGTSLTSDPRVRFDRLSNRWFVVMINVPSVRINNSVLIAVSDGSAITAGTVWRFYAFQQNAPTPAGDSGCFSDYPTLGIDAHALYIGVVEFCLGANDLQYAGTAGFVVRKSSVVSGNAIVVSAFRNLTGTPDGAGPFTPQGVDNFDPAATEGYFIGADNAAYGLLTARRVSNPGGVPVLSANLFVNVLATSVPLTVRHSGNSNSTNGQLDALDDRLFAAHLRNGRLWTAHNIAVNNTGATDGTRTRDAARWYEIADLNTATPSLVQAGTLFADTATNAFSERNYFIPSIMVSGQGHAALGCTIAGANEFINAATAGRLASDTPGTLRAVNVFTTSTAAYNPGRNSGNDDGRRRWGDYSFTSLDPCDDMTMWTVQQYCDTQNSWGVRVAKLQAPPPATLVGANPPSIAAGQNSINVTITGLPTNGAGFYDPGDGFACRLRAEVSGGVSVNSVAYLNPTTVRLNLATTQASAGAKNITLTNPDGQSVTANNLLTVGNCAYTVTPTSQSFTAAGGTGTLNITTTSGCGWTAASNNPFITVTSANPASGNGTASFTVAATTGNARTGTLTVAGQTITINQSAGAGCGYALTPASKQFGAAGGYGALIVNAANDCVWTATTTTPFIRILTGQSGQASGTINYFVAPSTSPAPRSGALVVSGQSFTITQDAAPLELAVDDGTLETASGLSGGGTSWRVNRLTPTFYPASLNALSLFFPENSGVNVGDAFTLVIGVNADGDANIDNSLVQEIPATIRALGDFAVYPLNTPYTINSGDFVVGLKLTHEPARTPFARDTSLPDRERSYRSLDGLKFDLIKTLNTPGNYPLRAQLVRPPKLLLKAGARLVAESCAPANNAIDPGETVTVSVAIENQGSLTTDNLTGALQTTGGVTTSGITQSFGALAPGATATRLFTFAAGGTCGGTLMLTINLSDGAQTLGAHSYNFLLGGAAAVSSTYRYSAAPVAIPDGDERGVNIPLTVSGFGGALTDVNLRIDGTQCTAAIGAPTVGLTHDFVGDLVLRLTSPRGTTVTLMARPGGTANSGRNFCQTLLDDDTPSAPSIQQISPTPASETGPPYSGVYRPATPLAAFDGEDPNGTWTLNVADVDLSATGTVRGFSLILAPFACCQSGAGQLAYEADLAPRPNGNGVVTASDWTTLGRVVAGALTPTAGSEFQRADCAPRDSLGDGRLTAADFTQAGRYVVGLDAPTVAGGPLALNSLTAGLRAPVAPATSFVLAGRGALTVALTLAATGRENALSASLQFDAARWQFIGAEAGRDGALATVIVNDAQAGQGRIGLVVGLAAGQRWGKGAREVLRLRFQPVRGGPRRLRLQVDDAVCRREVVDEEARVVAVGNDLPLGFGMVSPKVRGWAIEPR